MPHPPDQVQHWLTEGIAAARSGHKTQARALLQRVVEVESDNPTAWLWLSGVLDDPLEQETCLEKALSLDPNNPAAHKGLNVVRPRATQVLLAKGVAAAEKGERETARTLLTQVVQREEEWIEAWTWLARLASTPEEQETCYTHVLTLDPHNAEAQNKLATLQQIREVAAGSLWNIPPAEPEETEAAPTLVAAVLGEDYVRQYVPPLPEEAPPPESPVTALWAQYEDELRCPYCAAPTLYEDRRCAACGNPLWLKVRRQEERSVRLWILIALQVLATIQSALAPLWQLYLISLYLGLTDFTLLFNVYFGINGTISPEMAQAALSYLSRGEFFLLWLPMLISAAFAVALYVRWTPMFYLMLISAVLYLFGSVALILNTGGGTLMILTGIGGVIVALLAFITTLKLEDDFKWELIRVTLSVDAGLKDGVAYLLRGRLYAAQKMWARAALHFRRAVALLPYQLDGHIAAATACIKLKNYELARHILYDAQRIQPQNAQIGELLKLLAAEEQQTPS